MHPPLCTPQFRWLCQRCVLHQAACARTTKRTCPAHAPRNRFGVAHVRLPERCFCLTDWQVKTPSGVLLGHVTRPICSFCGDCTNCRLIDHVSNRAYPFAVVAGPPAIPICCSPQIFCQICCGCCCGCSCWVPDRYVTPHATAARAFALPSPPITHSRVRQP